MFGYRVISRMTSRKDGVGEVVVSKDKTTPLMSALLQTNPTPTQSPATA